MTSLTRYTDAELRAELTRRRQHPDGINIVDITDDLVAQLRNQFTASRGSFPLTIACPHCHAPAGKRCRTRGGGHPRTECHIQRSERVGLALPRTTWYRCPDCRKIMKLPSTAIRHRSPYTPMWHHDICPKLRPTP